jgi:hypothetical protein
LAGTLRDVADELDHGDRRQRPRVDHDAWSEWKAALSDCRKRVKRVAGCVCSL